MEHHSVSEGGPYGLVGGTNSGVTLTGKVIDSMFDPPKVWAAPADDSGSGGSYNGEYSDELYDGDYLDSDDDYVYQDIDPDDIDYDMEDLSEEEFLKLVPKAELNSHDFLMVPPEERKRNLQVSAKTIKEQNQKFKSGTSTFFTKSRTGALRPSSDRTTDLESMRYIESLMRTTSAPETFIVPKDKLTSVKNQGNCGSCVAFATVAALEVGYLYQGAKFEDLDLSEQTLLDCAYDGVGADGCDGAYIAAYVHFLAKNRDGQLPHENVDPYKQARTKNACGSTRKNFDAGAKVAKAYKITDGNEDRLKTLVAKHGGVVVMLATGADMSKLSSRFMNYAGGVIDLCLENHRYAGGHAVTVVGYGTSPKGIKFWKVKNSWGDTWGENGYFKIKRGVNCNGIEKYAAAADVVKTGQPEPVPEPNPKPQPSEAACDLNTFRVDSSHPKAEAFNYEIDTFFKGVTSIVPCYLKNEKAPNSTQVVNWSGIDGASCRAVQTVAEWICQDEAVAKGWNAQEQFGRIGTLLNQVANAIIHIQTIARVVDILLLSDAVQRRLMSYVLVSIIERVVVVSDDSEEFAMLRQEWDIITEVHFSILGGQNHAQDQAVKVKGRLDLFNKHAHS
eukprot:snap_masked-scaffold110_size354795-processed-gene-2.19 protein:Tk03439 transcript:snap_masked-scaffold110_size354795-processed-gene-2.19-mRNA-1 annotation:"PREDICTED: zingipain-2-like"